MNRSAAASQHILMVFGTAPAMGTGKCDSDIAGTLCCKVDKASPGQMPVQRSAAAARRRLQRVSPQVNRRSP